MQHLPACVDPSITAATFCLCYTTANLATKECIRDLTTDHLRHFFRELHPVLLVNEMLHHFQHGTPASYLSLLNDHQPGSLGHECALTILYALKTLHIIHFLTFPATQDATYKHMPHDLSDIIRNVPSFATTLSLFHGQKQFQRCPCIYPHFLPGSTSCYQPLR